VTTRGLTTSPTPHASGTVAIDLDVVAHTLQIRTSAGAERAFNLEEMGEFVLPYEAVRTADAPDATLLSFLQSTYEAGADLGDWDRDALEWEPPVA